jgi:hypothetical protein
VRQAVPIVILGTDAILAASPATPVQLAHACLRAGFANVVPASWGDELVAAAVLRRLPNFGGGPVIQCSCPIVAHRLLTVGGDLRPVLLPLVPPPVAVARYVRSLAQPTRTRITYVGACPGAVDESIDIRMTPEALIAMLAERDIVLEDQPHVFESVLPPDRRRYRSQPGGVPTAEALWTELGSRTLVEVDGDDFIGEVAQLLLTGRNVLIDTSARLGCSCSGAVGGERHPRAAIVALEPPRSTTPVVDEQTPIDLDLPVPATSRTPVDVVAVPTTPPSPRPTTPPGGIEAQVGSRFSPVRAGSSSSEPPRAPRVSNPVVPRSVLSAFPVARDIEGRSLPRAYVARRRSSPRGVSFTLPPEDAAAESPMPLPEPAAQPAPPVTQPVRAHVVAPAPAAPTGIEARPVIAQPPAIALEPVTQPVIAPAQAPSISSSVAAASAPAVAPGAPYTTDLTPSPALRQAQPWAPPAPLNDASIDRPVRDAAPAPTSAVAARRTPAESSRSSRPMPPAPPTLTRGQLVGILIAIAMIAISVSTVVAIIVGRSVTASVNTPLGR